MQKHHKEPIQSPELTLTLIRGLPGSGKSTLASKMGIAHLEADMFFVDEAGVYTFQPQLIQKAHQWCQSQCELLLQQKQSVVVSNTFVKHWEMQVYQAFAKQYNAKLVITTCTGKYQSIHDIPDATLAKMTRQWQP
ncbi:ATP-binding protein [Psychromonas sp. Urea-02u-13]|uniref:ATP-binding protein n=1 Tax=Psychromonas sp. Urea-02u-13 TaxID=2058326 RepID=UPI000C31CB87|nr:ATP-binding protein [Psychromonas sp. Urea-02u-13]PKG38111.1 AAA family ATPase [Psychromonas sp. Urea-02u-13]